MGIDQVYLEVLLALKLQSGSRQMHSLIRVYKKSRLCADAGSRAHLLVFSAVVVVVGSKLGLLIGVHEAEQIVVGERTRSGRGRGGGSSPARERRRW